MVGFARMSYTELNGLKISKYTLGTAQLGIPGYGISNRTSRIDAAAILDFCVSSGINSFDTARDYGTAEEQLGHYFSGKTPPLVSSKIKVRTTERTPLEIETDIRKEVETSLDALRMKQIPILLIHDPDMLKHHGNVVTRALRNLRDEGLIAKAGISLGGDTERQYREYCAIFRDETYEVIQVPINVLDQRLLRIGAIRDFIETNKIVFARSVFLQGLLLMNPNMLPDKLSDAEVFLRKLENLADYEGISVSQLAVSYIRDLEGISSLVIGAETVSQVSDNLTLLNGPRLSEKVRDQISKMFNQVPNHIVTPSMWSIRKRGGIPDEKIWSIHRKGV